MFYLCIVNYLKNNYFHTQLIIFKKNIVMKKFASIAAIALFAVGFTSCKKDFTCTCTDADGNETASYQFPSTTKKLAQEGCDVWNNGISASGGKCDLK